MTRYTNEQLCDLLKSLLFFSRETEWIEFKHNNVDPEIIGKNLSALANAALLHYKELAYLVWGIDDQSHQVVGTTFSPHQEKVGNQELESWCANLLSPRVNFTIHEFNYDNKKVVLFIIKALPYGQPVSFKSIEYIRVGSYTKKLQDYPEKERSLWLLSSKKPFEKEYAKERLPSSDVLSLLDYPAYFYLLNSSLPDNKASILERLISEKIITKVSEDEYNITNLGAILFAKKLNDFETLGRKSVRVIIYKGTNKVNTVKEHINEQGYANGFQSLIAYINDQIPQNEQIGQSLRKEVKIYPEIAIRELVANAIIHQDFNVTGSSPMVEIYTDRIEITNYGTPLIDKLRLIDENSPSRNEALGAFMRRLNICEERGSGMKKVIYHVELYQLPAPQIIVTNHHTKVVLYAYKRLTEMSLEDKIRACYQHACLQNVSNKQLTNASLRERFAIDEKNAAIASRIIMSTVQKGLIKPADAESTSRKHIKYMPFWA